MSVFSMKAPSRNLRGGSPYPPRRLPLHFVSRVPRLRRSATVTPSTPRTAANCAAVAPGMRHFSAAGTETRRAKP
jgi:hypothetical protein